MKEKRKKDQIVSVKVPEVDHCTLSTWEELIGLIRCVRIMMSAGQAGSGGSTLCGPFSTLHYAMHLLCTLPPTYLNLSLGKTPSQTKPFDLVFAAA